MFAFLIMLHFFNLQSQSYIGRNHNNTFCVLIVSLIKALVLISHCDANELMNSLDLVELMVN